MSATVARCVSEGMLGLIVPYSRVREHVDAPESRLVLGARYVRSSLRSTPATQFVSNVLKVTRFLGL